MTEISSFFSDKYKILVEQSTKEHFEDFKNAESANQMVQLLYPHVKDVIIKPAIYGKNYNEALKNKNDGNSYFAQKQIEKALECYTAGIIKCPQDDLECQETFAVLAANRSACLFELKEYEKALLDINFTLLINSYPKHLNYKLYLREAKCYSHSKDNKHLALKSYELALQFLDSSNIDTATTAKKKQEINNFITQLNKVLADKKTRSLPQDSNHTTMFVGSKNFPSVISAVTFKKEKDLGRYALAAADIDVDTIIVHEKAYCAVLAPDFMLSNCQYCMCATNTPVPCKKCANVVFCSLQCRENANSYHDHECGLHPTLFETGASINCLMALRIVSQSSIDYFLSISKDTDKGRCIIANSDQLDHCDYSRVDSLCRHEGLRSQEENFHYTIMAIYLLRTLKTTRYFTKITNDDILTENENFIGAIILQNLQMLQFNAHEISELQEAPPGPLDPQDEANFKAIYIGGGVYPTLALFNHSCDPSIVRYNIGSNMIVKTVKPVKQGQTIYENYGPIYTNVVKTERRQFLKERYWFDCMCTACIEDWPLFNSMEDAVVKIPCKASNCGSFTILHNDIQDVSPPCLRCGKNINLFPHLQALSKLEVLLPQAEEMYKQRKYDDALELYIAAIRIYAKNTVPPFPDWVKVQQRLRTCMVSKGNKCLKYMKVRSDT